jgi:hypothetical protein
MLGKFIAGDFIAIAGEMHRFPASNENIVGDFRKSIKILKFLSPLLHVPLPFTKRTCCTMILKRMQLTSLK